MQGFVTPDQKKSKAQIEKQIQGRSTNVSRDVGWTPVKPTKVTATDSKDKLLPNGWSVPIKSAIAEMRSTEPGICLASTAEARKLVNELKGEHPLAILAPANITCIGEEVHVLVEDPTGRWQTRRRFMLQLGTGAVTYMEGKPKKSVVGDSVNVILSLAKHHTDA